MPDTKKKPVRLGKKKSDSQKVSDDLFATLDTNVTAIIKADAQIVSNALEVEDTFADLYTGGVLQPEINPEQYYAFNEQNNTLNQCISAMEVNIDGTGHTIVRADGEEMADADEKAIAPIKNLFDEVFPGTSFLTMRRENRRQLEIAGYGIIEAIRNAKDEVVFMRNIQSKTVRLLKLDQAVTATKKMIRGGVEATLNLQVRERRFVQLNNNKKVYFKEFGSSRDLDKKTGVWAKQGERLPAQDRASEVIYTTVHKSSNSPYGVPRWLNNLPSVIGSRSAEELNLEYFQSGGIPPMMVFVSGGAMAEKAREQLEALLGGRAKDKLKGIVADIQSTSGTVEKAGNVRVDVETFGSEKQQDSMFEKYDQRCEQRIRAAFRLPPLFVGKADDYSFASVFASYTVAEAQVFAPERQEFDELINNTIMKEMTGGKYHIQSMPLTVADAETNLKVLELAMNGESITKRSLTEALNMVGSLNLQVLPDSEDVLASRHSGPLRASRSGETGEQGEGGVDDGVPLDDGVNAVKKTDLSYLADIADLQVKLLTKGMNKKEKAELAKLMKGLNHFQTEMIEMLTSNKVYASVSHDSEGMSELCGCVAEINKAQHPDCPEGQVLRDGVCVDKADAGEVTGPGGVNDHTHILLSTGLTTEAENHVHTWVDGDAETSEANGHTHTISG